MRTKILLLCCCCLCNCYVFSQIVVSTNGNVGVKTGSFTPLSPLSIKTQGNSDRIVSIESDSSRHYGLYSMNNSSFSVGGQNTYGIWGRALCSSAFTMGVWGASYLSSPSSSGRAFGVQGRAGNATSGYNIGVAGIVSGTNNGAGILGGTGDITYSIDSRYAGYFAGNVKITGAINSQSLNNVSDYRLKRNIENISSKSVNNVLKLIPVHYNLNQVYIEEQSDTVSSPYGFFSEETDFEKLHYGLIAQDVQQVFPELVSEDGNGYLSVNYIELIPILISAVQNLSEEVKMLKEEKEYDKSKKIIKSGNTQKSANAVLYQNTPNPFNQTTKISYELPVDTKEAALYIYNMQGLQIEEYPIFNFGSGDITISGGHLAAGMYLYSLIVDGQVVDTKQMILTK